MNTGEVLAGNPVASQDLVIGDAVNVAARLEEAAAPGETVIGRQTWRLVRDGVRAEPIEPLALKGKSEPVQAYRLLEVLPGAEAVTRHLDAPMVGRERQLDRLLDAFESAAAERSAHLVTLLGPPGVGKSRLAEELVHRVRDRATVVRGRCLPYGEGITYWPVIEIVTQAAGITPEDGPEAASAKILELVRDEPEGMAVADRISETIGAKEPEGDLSWAVRPSSRRWPGPSRWSPCSTTSTGPSPCCSTSSSTSPRGPGTRRSCSSAWPGPTCWRPGRPGPAARPTPPP